MLIFPENPKFQQNCGEEKVYRYLKEVMPNNSVTYYNYRLNGKQFDFCIAIEGKGVILIEVKSWRKDNIDKVIDNNYIKLKNGNVVRSPQGQAREYVEILWEKSKDVLGVDIPILDVSWFTNLSELDFKEKELNKSCVEELTLFKGDFASKENFIAKLNKIFNFAAKYNSKEFLNFNSMRFHEFRSIFETSSTLDYIQKKINRGNEKKFYSILKATSNFCKYEMKSLLNHWSCGTKLYIIMDNKNSYNKFKEEIKTKLESINLESHLKEVTNTERIYISYNINIYYIDKLSTKSFEIIDGHKDDIYMNYEKLEYFDNNSYFNLGQYEVEHSTSKNIEVKAGAGTGKTHTMISRIMYLLYKHKYTNKQLEEKIVMITFTRDAANSMREKIKEEFTNYYLLTKDINYIDYINSITNMHISTIDSLIKKLIESYGFLLGYGIEVKVTKGVMERRLGLDKILNNEILNNNHDVINEEVDLNYFKLQKFLIELINKIEGRNINLLEDNIDFGNIMINRRNNLELNRLINNTIISSEKITRENIKKNNKIILSQLLVELRNILGKVSKSDLKNNYNIDYMFIDEFQDTDNYQIDLVNELFKNIGFKLFIVGDIKQCIYRFRGAEEDAFKRLISNYTEEDWGRYTLRKNYRTNKLLLDKYESVFKKLGDENLLSYLEKDKLESGTGVEKEKPIRIVEVKNDFEDKLLECLSESYKKLSKITQYDKNKKSIGILVRSNKQLEEIIDIGNRNSSILSFSIKNPSIGNLYNIESTIDLYKLVLALLYNKNPKYLFGIYDTNYIKQGFNLWEVYKVMEDFDGDKYEIYKNIMLNWPIDRWDKYIVDIRKETTLMVLREIIYDIKPWNNYGLEHSGIINQDKAKYYKDNLDLLFEKININSDSDYLTLPKIEEFLRIMITTGMQEETRSQENNINNIDVVCTTIHKSKGLEYNTVIMPYTDSDIGSNISNIIIEDRENGYTVGYKISKEIQNDYYKNFRNDESNSQKKEEIRILYVALTRAIDDIVLFKYDEIVENSVQEKLGGLYK